MKLSDYKQSYYDFSGSSSTVTRQAAFAGIALIWIFNGKVSETIVLPLELLWPTLFLIACLACDLLHYILASAIWDAFHRLKEKQGVAQDALVTAPPCFNWPALILFWAKHCFVLLGYSGLFMYVYSAIEFSST
ncbi:hypothetical protein Sps_03457 [Shewanella psychrophila]|uniref:Uncharacterized protein n=1 Tax=Shewanella psychrophila TaxID=225848 RepID=A0A1S6HSX5_9GAMM|nr:hypothetical protein [Shewanella psychrophila]AQS38584.1 hypothetical protein Sps_03457 [Shewanella psychrophila]